MPMNISSDYTLTSVNSDKLLNVNRDDSPLPALKEGDILSGVFTQVGDSPRVYFDELQKEIDMPAENYRYSSVGEKHSFRVMSTSDKRLVLKDLGIDESRQVQSPVNTMTVADTGLLRMTKDFSDTMDSIESKENETINRSDDEDIKALRNEGFTIEDFKIERLAHAIERVHEGREQKAEDIETQVDTLREDRRDSRRHSARNAAGKYDTQCRIADRLFSSDQMINDPTVTDNILSDAAVSDRSGYTGRPLPRMEVSLQAPVQVSDDSTIKDVMFRLHLEQIRLTMAADSSKTSVDITVIENNIDVLRGTLENYYRELSFEFDIDDGPVTVDKENAIDLAVRTSLAVTDIAQAPVSFYRGALLASSPLKLEALATIARETTIREEDIDFVPPADTASDTSALPDRIERPASSRIMHVLDSYDSSRTEIRRDLGDSVKKAFDNIDEVLRANNLDLTDANRRAVRICTQSGMEVTPENIDRVKFFDSRVTTVIEGLKPAVVLSLIRKGINPLETGLDRLNDLIRDIEEDNPLEKDLKFSSFLVRLESHGGISEDERNAYIGIFRLLHNISRDDYAAIGTVLEAGEDMNFKNLLKAQRSRAAAGIDTSVNDTTVVVHTSFVNSISDQIASAFDYNRRLTDKILQCDNPETVDEALGEYVPDNEIENLTLEQVAEKLKIADKEHAETSQLPAAAIKYLMSYSPEYRRLLKALGVKDTIRNLAALIDGTLDDSLFIEAPDMTALLDSMESRESLEAYTDRTIDEELEALDKAISEGNVTGGSSPAATDGITALVDRYNLLKDLASKEHFRFTLGDEASANVTMTLIHDKVHAGSVDIDITTDTLNLIANLSASGVSDSAETHTVVFGSVTCEDYSQVPQVNELLRQFVENVGSDGIDASGITVRTKAYGVMQRIERIKKLVEHSSTEEATDDATLYKVAKQFLKVMINTDTIR